MDKVLPDGTVVLDTKDGIEFYQLLALRGACKLETLGMKRRGRSALAIARERYGLPKRAPADLVLITLNREVEERQAKRQLALTGRA